MIQTMASIQDQGKGLVTKMKAQLLVMGKLTAMSPLAVRVQEWVEALVQVVGMVGSPPLLAPLEVVEEVLQAKMAPKLMDLGMIRTVVPVQVQEKGLLTKMKAQQMGMMPLMAVMSQLAVGLQAGVEALV